MIGILLLTGCSKASDTVTDSGKGPDNAVTRYGQNLASSEQHAAEIADRANAAIARQQNQMNQATQSGTNQ